MSYRSFLACLGCALSLSIGGCLAPQNIDGTQGSGGANGTGGSTVTHPPQITGGVSGWASRYWDCCKPACGWKGNVTRGNPMMSCDMSDKSLGSNYDAVNACQGGGTAYMCWSGVPWS